MFRVCGGPLSLSVALFRPPAHSPSSLRPPFALFARTCDPSIGLIDDDDHHYHLHCDLFIQFLTRINKWMTVSIDTLHRYLSRHPSSSIYHQHSAPPYKSSTNPTLSDFCIGPEMTQSGRCTVSDASAKLGPNWWRWGGILSDHLGWI